VPEPEQRRIYQILDAVLPVSLRAKGLLNEGAVVGALRPLPLERIAAPTLIASVENDGYQTFAGARYTADRIPARASSATRAAVTCWSDTTGSSWRRW